MNLVVQHIIIIWIGAYRDIILVGISTKKKFTQQSRGEPDDSFLSYNHSDFNRPISWRQHMGIEGGHNGISRRRLTV